MPPWLQPLTDLNSQNTVVGVAILLSDPARGQLHCGVVYQYEGAPSACLLHLAFHARLRLDCPPTSGGFLWVAPPIDELRVDAVAVLCERIWKRRQSIPYGVLYDGGQFTRDGVLELGAAAHGLTCATFVMHVFRSAGIELLEWAAWPIRTTDAEWHQQIVSELENFRIRFPDEISEEHIKNVRGELGCARFRPEEVTGACSSTQFPASFDFTVAAGRQICEVLFN